MADIELPRSDNTLRIRIPDNWLGEVVRPRAVVPDADVSMLIKNALDSPIGTPMLSQLASPGQTVAIIVDDYTRKTPAHLILPFVIQELMLSGVDRKDIKITIALGTHRPMTQAEIWSKVGSDIASQYEIINTPCSTESEMVYLGDSSNGIPVWAQRFVAEADVRIGVGMITPHMDTGFSGGAKIIMPGVCNMLTVDTFHSHAIKAPANQLGKINAPLRQDLEQLVCERVQLDFIVNLIMTLDHGIYQCVAGHAIDAHRVGVKYAQEVYAIPLKRRYPIVVANCYPYQQDLWQSTKGIACGDLFTGDGGTLVLVTQAAEGNSTYPLYPYYIGIDPDELKNELDANNVEDPKAAVGGVLVGWIKQRIDIVLVSDGLTRSDADIMGMEYFDTVETAVKAKIAKLIESHRQQAVAVITHAGILLPQAQ